MVGEPEAGDPAGIVTLSLERADGIEKVAFRCTIPESMLHDPDSLLKRLGPWVERQFEQLREAALRSARSEHKLLQIAFGATPQLPA